MGNSAIKTLIKRRKKRIGGKVIYLTSMVVDFDKRVGSRGLCYNFKKFKNGTGSNSSFVPLKKLTPHDVFTVILIIIIIIVLFML
jgi:hypothetical protein